jgi:hypothetical protein
VLQGHCCNNLVKNAVYMDVPIRCASCTLKHKEHLTVQRNGSLNLSVSSSWWTFHIEWSIWNKVSLVHSSPVTEITVSELLQKLL